MSENSNFPPLAEFQRKMLKETGLFPIMVQGGQVSRYRETIYYYEVVDVYQQYNGFEKDKIVLELCAKFLGGKILKKITGALMLEDTVLEFRKIGTYCYVFKHGHDYTD